MPSGLLQAQVYKASSKEVVSFSAFLFTNARKEALTCHGPFHTVPGGEPDVSSTSVPNEDGLSRGPGGLCPPSPHLRRRASSAIQMGCWWPSA